MGLSTEQIYELNRYTNGQAYSVTVETTTGSMSYVQLGITMGTFGFFGYEDVFTTNTTTYERDQALPGLGMTAQEYINTINNNGKLPARRTSMISFLTPNPARLIETGSTHFVETIGWTLPVAPLDSNMKITQIIDKTNPNVWHGSPISPAVINEIESILSLTFHEELREYLQTFGWLAIGSWQLMGVSTLIKEIRQHSLVRESTRFMALSGRKAVAIAHDGGDGFVVFDASVSGVVDSKIRLRLMNGEEDDWQYNDMTLFEWISALSM